MEVVRRALVALRGAAMKKGASAYGGRPFLSLYPDDAKRKRYAPSSASANSSALKGCKSSTFSPTPMK